jgi:hypothetical protein
MSALGNYLRQPNNQYQLSYLGIRTAVGILGFSLPIVCRLGTWIFSGCTYWKDSISDYYYTIMGNVFTGILCGVALFLFSYKGFNRWDSVSSSLAAAFALGVAFFPMNVSSCCVECTHCNIISRAVQPWRNYVHYGSAALLFFTLACMSFFLFTKTDQPKPKLRKRQRNVVYRVCGIVMFAALLASGSLNIKSVAAAFPHSHPVYWMETIMLFAFGTSWLVKGEVLLKDLPESKTT